MLTLNYLFSLEKVMKKYHLLSLFVLSVFIFISSCDTPQDDALISGQVINSSSGEAISEAVVVITAPQEFLNESRITDADGGFTFSGLTVNEATDIVIEARKTGFERVSVTVTVTPGQTVNLETPIGLVLEDNGDGDGDGDGGGGVAGPSAGPAQIILTSISRQAINIAETGDQISSPFTFQVQDSSGRALTSSNPATVNFSIITGPGGGEEITPSSLQTNANGEVTTALFSGNRAGAVKIQASITRDDGIVVRSTPVLIAIHGGFPDLDHFSITSSPSNIEGYNINNVRSTITVIVGDKFSNPVKPGTVVYFETTGGIIQGSAQTNDDGLASVELISADPRPADGFVIVTAKTVDENDILISKTETALFSGIPQITNVNPTTFDILPNGGESFTFTATDQNGNPLAAGTTFSVEVGEGLDATGDANFDLGDYLFPGTGSTQFAFSVSDTDEEASDRGGTTITIRVTTPTGKQASFPITGFRAKRKN